MRAVIQRVSRAQVFVDAEAIAGIGPGLLILLGVGKDDVEDDCEYLAAKTAGLRIFEDAAGKMNLSARDAGAQALVVSQFTLYGDVRRGKRPSFDEAALPEHARLLYEYFVKQLRATGMEVQTGRFGANMQVESVNDGPVTILIDSKRLF